MAIFSFLPSTLFRPSPTNNFEGDPFAKICANFGLGATDQNPFYDYFDSFTDGRLHNPFELSIGSSFGVVNDSFYTVNNNLVFCTSQNFFENDTFALCLSYVL